MSFVFVLGQTEKANKHNVPFELKGNYLCQVSVRKANEMKGYIQNTAVKGGSF